MPRETDTVEYSDNSAGSKISVGPKTSLAVASFDPDGFVALGKGQTMVYVTFRQAGTDPSLTKGIDIWASCDEKEKAAPRQLMATLPKGLYETAIFTTNTKDGLTEQIMKCGEVFLKGTLTVS
jgi:hypothetical protein